MKPISLGPLEQEIMRCVWQKKECTARDVVNYLIKERKIAYNTIQTIMTRLVDKGLLERSLNGKTHLYKTTIKKKNALKSIMSQTMNGLINRFGDEALVAFVDGLDEISEETKQKLILKLQKK